jgi:hypothetical protein
VSPRALRLRTTVRYATACAAVILLAAACAWAGGVERVAW